MWFAWKFYVMQERWCMSLHRCRLPWQTSQFHWDLQFQSGVLEALNRAVTLGFGIARLLQKLESVSESKSSQTLGKVTFFDALRKVTKNIFRGRRSTLQTWRLKKVISPHRRRVSWKWHVCVAVTLGLFAVSGWCFRGVEPRCYIGICIAERLPRSSLLREIWWKMLVLDVWVLTFGESLVENTWFGSLDSHFLVTVSWKMLVTEAWIVTFGQSHVVWSNQEGPARVSIKSVKQECAASMAS